MKEVTALVWSLVRDIVAGVRALVAGDVPLREGLRSLLGAVVALAVAIVLLRAMAWGLGDAFTRVVSRLLGAA